MNRLGKDLVAENSRVVDGAEEETCRISLGLAEASRVTHRKVRRNRSWRDRRSTKSVDRTVRIKRATYPSGGTVVDVVGLSISAHARSVVDD